MTYQQFGPNGWTPERLANLSGKTYLITGANSGTGFEAAKILLSKGAKVIMLNRNAEKSYDAMAALKNKFGENADIEFVQMDLADLNSVRSAAKLILEKTPHINALICNAAIAQVPKQSFTKDGFESQIGVNHYGHFLLCGLLFDRIDASLGHIVVVSSLGYKMGIKAIQFDDMNWDKNYQQNSTYCHSKLAQMMFAYELQNKIKNANRNVKVYVCHPGSSATSLISTSANFLTKSIWYLMTKTPMVQSAEKGAYPEIMCATENELEERALYGPTGRMEMVGPVGTGTLLPFAHDEFVMKKLWQITEDNIGYSWRI
ncbi:oxidoreductase [Sphingorhabdus lutea]|uniref:Oxidoreductase n=1 Tax=Sphingorhabdus lutea TaxID=1913578 RepID=A0A1L3JA50_9SPHN|nr:SDR family oxidoreductase [Sphingorhabdus lutea]APG62010.1 oxidoreductase [Sphingorhabdus lutea]